MQTLMPTDLPPVSPEGAGDEQKWASDCLFDAQIPPDVCQQIFEVIERPAAVVLGAAPEGGDSLVFRTRGFMDVATVETAQVLRQFMGSLITASLTEVYLINHDDAFRCIWQKRPLEGYNITQTVKELLRQTS